MIYEPTWVSSIPDIPLDPLRSALLRFAGRRLRLSNSPVFNARRLAAPRTDGRDILSVPRRARRSSNPAEPSTGTGTPTDANLQHLSHIRSVAERAPTPGTPPTAIAGRAITDTKGLGDKFLSCAVAKVLVAKGVKGKDNLTRRHTKE